jgi:hypothetical protein
MDFLIFGDLFNVLRKNVRDSLMLKTSFDTLCIRMRRRGQSIFNFFLSGPEKEWRNIWVEDVKQFVLDYFFSGGKIG